MSLNGGEGWLGLEESGYYEERSLAGTAASSNYGYAGFFNNSFVSQANNFTNQLKRPADLSIKTVLSSLYVNAVVFVCLMATYEILRRHFPLVYTPRKVRLAKHEIFGTKEPDVVGKIPTASKTPLGWVAPVFGVSWQTVRKAGGLDAYFFLRYIRMCVRITAVSSFWALIILAPVYSSGGMDAIGWYHISMANIAPGGWRTWISVIFMYLLSLFVFFVMKQEYVHFLQLRMDFLGKDDRNVNPQHHYSMLVENIPMEMRSDTALFGYFESLFPGRVHSAHVILNLPELEALSAKRLQITQLLEKAIAEYHAIGERPSHIVADQHDRCCGVDCGTKECCGCIKKKPMFVEENSSVPKAGAHVDSISYYTRLLVECNRKLFLMQEHKKRVAETGNTSARAVSHSWFVKIVDMTTEAAATIMEDSEDTNELGEPHDSTAVFLEDALPLAERMTSFYGSFGGAERTGSAGTPQLQSRKAIPARDRLLMSSGSDLGNGSNHGKRVRLVADDHLDAASQSTARSVDSATRRKTVTFGEKEFVHPFARSKHASVFRRMIGRCGLDFFVAGLRWLQSKLDVTLVEVVGARMSSTGFVTFLDLASLTSAVSVPLTHKPNILKVSVAPEPRDIRWKSAHIPEKVIARRITWVNYFLALGVILWSLPLAAIQAFATAKSVAKIPGLEWILTFQNGQLTGLINGYLPVLALLTLMLMLPVVFQAIAVGYENRKTHSEVQRSILFRYFYYQVANIYITVSAGSLWTSLADILNSPSAVFQLLGASLPTVVGYFVSLLLTKILAGLPVIFLRGGALSRRILALIMFRSSTLTQRELDEIHHAENVLYGWEYPSQLLVIVICFTYACICPIILPFGALFFGFALMVYKKQVLYVYTPLYESGGTFFPLACDCTLFGLVCGQLTLIGYIVVKDRGYERFWFPLLLPLPILTIVVMRYFRRHYAKPSNRLSMERAMERDRVADKMASMDDSENGAEVLRQRFDKEAYRQPVLAERIMTPMPYRRDKPDEITDEACHTIRQKNRLLAFKTDLSLERSNNLSGDSLI